jgi:hypothetical protein
VDWVERLALLLVVGFLLGIALLVAAHWVDIGDSTCGGFYRLDLWVGEEACQGQMLLRAGAVVGLLGVAGVVATVAFRTRPD